MKLENINLLLPTVFQQSAIEGTPLYALLSVMEKLHEQTQTTLTNLDRYFDGRRAPDSFVPMLAYWIDLGWLITGNETGLDRLQSAAVLSDDRLRDLLIASPVLVKKRGTAEGIGRFLALAVGDGMIQLHENINPAGVATPFHLWVEADALLKPQEALLEKIVSTLKPVYLTFEITYLKPKAG